MWYNVRVIADGLCTKKEEIMEKCKACGSLIILGKTFGKTNFCMVCASTANVSSWVSRDFSSLEELNLKKNEILQKVTASNMSKAGIEAITNYFDEYNKEGFITTINGKAGQTLKIFKNYCVVNTKNEDKKNELINMFYQFDDEIVEDCIAHEGSALSASDKKALAQGIMSGKWIQAGIGAVVSATISNEEKEIALEKKYALKKQHCERLIKVGDKRIDFKKIKSVEIYTRSGATNGYLKFVPKGVASTNLYSCEFFFFNNSIPFESKKIRKKAEEILDIINDRIFAIDEEEKIAATIAAEKKAEKQAAVQAEQIKKMVEHATQQSKTDAFEEIRKYKQLFDEGIISEEEFNTKKKQILNL